jgi:ComF family protein
MACRTLLPLNDKRSCEIWLCHTCESLIQPLTETVKAPKAGFFSVNHAAFVYDGILRDIIRDIKFRNKKNHARALGRLWADVLAPDGFNPVAGLVPVPLHPKKYRERGFNQAGEMAKELSKKFSIPIKNVLIRIIDTLPQVGLHPLRRIENVAGAFELSPNNDYTVEGKSFILIDDIYTTGASLNECARILVENGAKEVRCKTFCITLKKEGSV